MVKTAKCRQNVLNTGYWILDTGYWVLVLDTGARYWNLEPGTGTWSPVLEPEARYKAQLQGQ